MRHTTLYLAASDSPGAAFRTATTDTQTSAVSVFDEVIPIDIVTATKYNGYCS